VPRAPIANTSNVLPGEQIPPGSIPQPIMDDSGRIVGYETPDQTMAALRNRTPFVPPAPVAAPPAPVAAPPAPVVQPPVAAPPVVQPPVAAPAAVAPVAIPVQATVQPPPPIVQERQLEAWQQDLVDAQKDPKKLNAYIANEKNPAEGRTMAETLLKQQYKRQEEEARTERDMKAFISGDRKAVTDVMKRLSSKSEEGSLFKAYLYNRFGMHELAKQEQQKLGGTNFERMMLGNQNYLVEVNPQGGITGAFDAKGKAVGEDVLTQLNAGAMNPKQTQAHTGKMRDTTTGKIYYEVTTNGQTRLIEPGSGDEYKGPSNNLMVYGVGTELGASAYKEYNTKASAYNQENVGKGFQPYRWSDGTFRTGPEGDYTSKVLPDGRILDWKTYNGVTGSTEKRPPIPVTPPVTPPAIRRPASYQTEGPISPTEVQPGMMTTEYNPNQGGMPIQGYAGGQPTGGGMMTTQYLPSPSEQKTQRELGAYGSKAEIDVGKKKTEELNTANRTYSNELANSRQTATSQKSTIDRLQTAIDKNPNFWGIDTNSTAWRAYVDINSTNENKAEALNTLARNLNIPANKRAEFDQTMNDYRNLQVNAITGSGLTASQTNTERESQRVMGTIGGISDRPAAAKATLEYAKAKIEYAETKAKDWAQARKANPNLDRLEFEVNFDDTKGEKIFKDANERMNKILGVSSSPATSGLKDGQTSVSKSGKPIVVRNGKWEYQ
jgi:hypothetical protein